ncbi:hypothetical protein MZK47_07275 [Microbacterium aerolatum]|uniref:hypothetical protein n=1 Tax=Microbacterium aerolatum TaxID=153731 RepID=UPI00200126D5|nr:hypothetical protein [Microbacterium aerolatum]MCK3769465.1 hypothetical protein [Microbacterium aerolatum]
MTEKPITEFPRNASTADGRGAYCRPCHAKAAKRSRERARAKYAEMVALLSPSDRARLGIAD